MKAVLYSISGAGWAFAFVIAILLHHSGVQPDHEQAPTMGLFFACAFAALVNMAAGWADE